MLNSISENQMEIFQAEQSQRISESYGKERQPIRKQNKVVCNITPHKFKGRIRKKQNQDSRVFHRGEIYYVKGGEVTGSEQGGTRPAIIVGNETGLKYGPVAEIVYMTTKKKASLPTHPFILSGKEPSIALCEHVVTVDKSRILDHIGHLTKNELKKVDRALAISLQLEKALKDPDFIRSLLSRKELSDLVTALLAELQEDEIKEDHPKNENVRLGFVAQA